LCDTQEVEGRLACCEEQESLLQAKKASAGSGGSAHAAPKETKRPKDDTGNDDTSESAACSAHPKCGHLDGECCPSAAGKKLDCCSWTGDDDSDQEKGEEKGHKDGKKGKGAKSRKWGKKPGHKYELKGKYVKTKDEGGTRDNPRDKVKSLSKKLGLSEDWEKAKELYKEIKTKKDAAKKAEKVMKYMCKDEKKMIKATVREKKEMVSSLLREMFKHFTEEDAGKGKKTEALQNEKGESPLHEVLQAIQQGRRGRLER
jgi:hypothetical protein